MIIADLVVHTSSWLHFSYGLQLKIDGCAKYAPVHPDIVAYDLTPFKLLSVPGMSRIHGVPKLMVSPIDHSGGWLGRTTMATRTTTAPWPQVLPCRPRGTCRRRG